MYRLLLSLSALVLAGARGRGDRRLAEQQSAPVPRSWSREDYDKNWHSCRKVLCSISRYNVYGGKDRVFYDCHDTGLARPLFYGHQDCNPPVNASASAPGGVAPGSAVINRYCTEWWYIEPTVQGYVWFEAIFTDSAITPNQVIKSSWPFPKHISYIDTRVVVARAPWNDTAVVYYDTDPKKPSEYYSGSKPSEYYSGSKPNDYYDHADKCHFFADRDDEYPSTIGADVGFVQPITKKAAEAKKASVDAGKVGGH